MEVAGSGALAHPETIPAPKSRRKTCIGSRVIDPSLLSVHPDRASVTRALARHLVQSAAAAIAERGRFTWALAGGSTPRELYCLLASDEFRAAVDWSKVEVFWGDERCVPPDAADSNFRMANEALLRHVPVPASQVYRMQGELEPEAAAEAYNGALRCAFPAAQYPNVPPALDVVLLGMGDDGHTASLFPSSPALSESQKWTCPAKKADQWRLTLTYPVLNAAREVLFLVTGSSKQTMLRNVLTAPSGAGMDRAVPWPAAAVHPKQGRLLWFVDRDAAAFVEHAVERAVVHTAERPTE